MWYLVKRFELYDRENILLEEFITQNFNKYKNNENYNIKKIKVK